MHRAQHVPQALIHRLGRLCSLHLSPHPVLQFIGGAGAPVGGAGARTGGAAAPTSGAGAAILGASLISLSVSIEA